MVSGKKCQARQTKIFCRGCCEFLTQRQIEVALKKLEKEGLIITGNYNKTPFDRTKWYAISQKGLMAL